MTRTNMLKTVITLTALSGILAFASCTTVKDRDPATHTTSTTTESTNVQQPVPASTETQTVRSY
jgi:hypothetical protein